MSGNSVLAKTKQKAVFIFLSSKLTPLKTQIFLKHMPGKLQQFIQKTKSKKQEALALEQAVHEKAMSLVPRCELNNDLPESASSEELWKGIHANFAWSFGPSAGKTLKDTKVQFLKWAIRKLKDPVMTICLIELMLREKQIIDVEQMKQASEASVAENAEKETVEAVADDAATESAGADK